MDSILKIVPYGENIPGPEIAVEQVVHLLRSLDQSLGKHSLEWHDISLLFIANSKACSDRHGQLVSDERLMVGLDQFCSEKKWYPALIGASVLGSFYRSMTSSLHELSDGLLFIAIASSVFDRIPVSIDITPSDDHDERKFAGRRALHDALRMFRQKVMADGEIELSDDSAASTSTGLILTTGSGYAENRQEVDFKDCFAVGQELQLASNAVGARLVGGCSTNRTADQYQCIYYSEHVGDRERYAYTYLHAAAVAFLPYQQATVIPDHPFHRSDMPKLDVKFHPHEQYDEGRYFFVKAINGKSPIEFLAEHWPFTEEELRSMVYPRKAIAATPKAHWITIASSLSRRDPNIWPNPSLWLEDIDGTILLRLIRAEDEDSNYYLMELQPEALQLGIEGLMRIVNTRFGEATSMITFICESRKYMLDDLGSNAEADAMLSMAPVRGSTIGIYLNGEYSTGTTKSIGYHNLSQIGVALPERSTNELPNYIFRRQRSANLKLFVCYGSRDNSDVKLFISILEEHLRGVIVWLDEKKLRTGDVLEDAIRSAIKQSNQFFIPFLSERSIQSDWVRRELNWAIEEEQKQQRTLVLPVVLDDRAVVMMNLRSIWDDALVRYVEQRKVLKVTSFTEGEFRTKARQLADDIVRWMT